jgi:hypothetical protein
MPQCKMMIVLASERSAEFGPTGRDLPCAIADAALRQGHTQVGIVAWSNH